MNFNAALETFLQVLSAGLLLGCLYGLMCAGLGLIFGVMRVINFAQGEFMMLGMYAGLYGVALFSPARAYAFPVAMGVSLLVAALFYGLGVATHKLLIGRVTGTRSAARNDSGHTAQLILTLGI